MDFSWTDEQRAFQQEVRDFADEHLNKDTLVENEQGDFSWEKWRACAKFGIQGLNIPVQYGGSGKGYPDDHFCDGRAGVRLS